MDVAPQPVVIGPHHENQLRVSLEPDQPVHDMDACPLEPSSPVQIVGFVEASLQFDQRDHLNASLSRANQGFGQLAVTGRSIQSHLDRLHFGIVSSLCHELLDRGSKGFVGMVNKQCPVAHHGEHRALGLGRSRQPARHHRGPWFVFEIRTSKGMQLTQTCEIDQCLVTGDVGGIQIELSDEQFEHLLVDAGLDLEPHCPSESSAAQFQFDGGQEIVGVLVLDRQVGITRHPKGCTLLDDHAHEESAQVGRDHILDRYEPRTVPERHQAGKDRWHLDPSETSLARHRIAHHGRQAQRQIRDVGERVSGIDRERRQDREDPLVEDSTQFDTLVG